MEVDFVFESGEGCLVLRFFQEPEALLRGLPSVVRQSDRISSRNPFD